MTNSRFNQDAKHLLDLRLQGRPFIRERGMFGYPAYFYGSKIFACVYEDVIGLKVPAAMASSLRGETGIDFFLPKGRKPMKEWIAIDVGDLSRIQTYEAVLESAIEYASSLTNRSIR